MSKVFKEDTLAGIVLKNHIIRSATYEGLSDKNGNPTEKLIKKYELLAKGEVGAIITGYIGVNQQAKSGDNMSMISTEENEQNYRQVTERVHAFGTPIIAQLVHCGGQGKKEASGMDVVSPSEISDYKSRAMTEEEIEETIESFVSAVVRSKNAGFDGVQLHLAHGYLLSEFLSPRMNRRTDKWGGTTENRCRIAVEIIKRARKKVGKYPIIVKMNGFETLKNGLTVEESVKIAKILEQAGIDGIEVSNGTLKAGLATIRGNVPSDMIIAVTPKLNRLPKLAKKIVSGTVKTVFPHPQPTKTYNLDAAIEIRKNVNIPVIVVGGITELSEIEDIIDNDRCDFVSMCRPFIIESDFVKKLRTGSQTKSKCIQCNFCIIGVEHSGLRCYYGKVPNAKNI